MYCESDIKPIAIAITDPAYALADSLGIAGFLLEQGFEKFNSGEYLNSQKRKRPVFPA